jgi:dolichol-phosphate mannosyltransferase
MDVLVVLPTFNEAQTIEEVLRRTRSAVPDASVLVVDDGSPDGTSDIAEKTGADLGQIEVMRRTAPQGLGDAYRAGFAWGLERGADVLIEMDSDLSHDPGALPTLVAAIDHSDLVIGSRYVPGGSIPQWAPHRRLLSRGGNVYSAVMLGVPVKDMTSGFRAYRADLLRRMQLETVRADGYGFQIEMTYRAARQGARITEVPIRFVDRELGESKMSSAIVVEALRLVTWWGVLRAARRLRRLRV